MVLGVQRVVGDRTLSPCSSLVHTCVVVAVVMPSSQRHWLAAKQWFTVQIVAELLQEAQHIRHTVHCRQRKSALLLVKVGCGAIGQRSEGSVSNLLLLSTYKSRVKGHSEMFRLCKFN